MSPPLHNSGALPVTGNTEPLGHTELWALERSQLPPPPPLLWSSQALPAWARHPWVSGAFQPASPAPRRGSSDSHTPCPMVASCRVRGSQDWREARRISPPWLASRRPRPREWGRKLTSCRGGPRVGAESECQLHLAQSPCPLASAGSAALRLTRQPARTTLSGRSP